MQKSIALATWNFGLEAVRTAVPILSKKGLAVDAVEEGIKAVESLGIRSVGMSGLPNADGKVELDASIMTGDRRGGGVAAVTGVAHPISLARKVMELTPHVLLVGDGALKFAKALGFDTSATPSPSSLEEWQKAKSLALKSPQSPPSPWYWANHDTVGMVTLDSLGNLCAGASTSGLAYKMPGRVGDSPILGSGVYAVNGLGAAAATGIGEIAMRFALAHEVVTLMRFLPAKDALDEALRNVRKEEPGSKEISLVAVDAKGNWGASTLRGEFPYAVWDGNEIKLLKAYSVL